MAYDARLVKLIEDVLGDVTGQRVSTRTAQRLAEEIRGDGYTRDDPYEILGDQRVTGR